MKNKFGFVLVMIAMMVAFSSCSKVPQAEIDGANAAIEAARAAGADVYLPEEFNALQDSMMVVNEMVEAAKGKMFGGYGDVKAKLAEITQMAATVSTNTETRKVEIQAELETAMSEVNTLIGEAKTLLANAPKGKEGKAAVEAIATEVTTVEAAVVEATGLVEQQMFVQGLDKLNAAKEKVTGIISELQMVIAKTKK